MIDINSAVEAAKAYYKENNIPIPINVTEYITNYPPGLSRQVISSKYNFKCSDFVKLLNPTYIPPLCAKDRALIEAARLNYEIVSDVSLLKNNRDTVSLKCIDCGYLHSATITSLAGTKLGCPLCKSGNLPWYKRPEELANICNTLLDAVIVSEIPETQAGYITLQHSCGAVYTTQLVGVVSPNSKNRGTCPNCRDSDRRVAYSGLVFGSEFEKDCYRILKDLNPELHVKYSNYFDTERRWVCDFKIGNYWIEVSNFKQDYKGYFSNIEEKRHLVESNGENFFFVKSLAELQELVSLM
jgi:hypothetical protein